MHRARIHPAAQRRHWPAEWLRVGDVPVGWTGSSDAPGPAPRPDGPASVADLFAADRAPSVSPPAPAAPPAALHDNNRPHGLRAQ